MRPDSAGDTSPPQTPAALPIAAAASPKPSPCHGFICEPRIYHYLGWDFEVNPSSGPWPLRADGELRKRAGRVFWKVWRHFLALTPEQQASCRTGGGCHSF